VIKKILKHLGLWEGKARPPPKVKAPSVTIYLEDSESQVLSPDSPMDFYRISKPHRATSLVTISAIDALFSNYRRSFNMILID